MKKIIYPVLTLILSTGLVFATCSIEDGVCTATTGFDNIRQPYKPIYNEFGSAADFGDDPVVRINPANREHVERTFRTQNEMQNTTNYDSNCQFGVCLPSDMSNSIR